MSMRKWEQVNLSECEEAKCICAGCAHGNERRRPGDTGDGAFQSCCARHSTVAGVIEDAEDICGILECPNYEPKEDE